MAIHDSTWQYMVIQGETWQHIVRYGEIWQYMVINSNTWQHKGHVTLLVMLDLSAAFDTVDHGILLHRLQSKLGLRDKALSWFKSYLAGRTQQLNLSCGVPQGSCLGPLLFTIYASSLFDILKSHLPSVHTYADDTQLYIYRLIPLIRPARLML